ncbi:hypothetical protein [Priestia megaterium]|uniref:hypothetical protein n=1 Tax=Priestia megaterium TaxID=1404 RepID=UPI002D8030FC|nr:hypothetical protein [Priestia megaterium]MEB4859752.1 hypothetical protein [Priestia megaterium]
MKNEENISKVGEFCKGIFDKIFREYFLHTIIFIIVLLIFSSLFSLEIAHGKATGYFDINFWLDNLIPNILADMIGIILTTFIIAGLFSKNNQLNEQNKLYTLIGADFENLMDTLSRNYLYLLHREENLLDYNSTESKKIAEEIKKIPKDSINIGQLKIMDNLSLDRRLNEYKDSDKNLIFRIPRVSSYLDKFNQYTIEQDKLMEEFNEIYSFLNELELKGDQGSEQYKEKLSKSKDLSKKINDHRDQIDKLKSQEELRNLSPQEVSIGYINFFKNNITEFNDKYNIAVPMEMKSSFLKLEKELEVLSRYIGYYKWNSKYRSTSKQNEDSSNNSFEIINDYPTQVIKEEITKSSKSIFDLLTYFDNLGNRKYMNYNQ